MTTPEQTATVIVGAGPAGLAVAACLQQAGQPYVLLEREQTVASSWRSRYDRLHLHTNRRLSELPYRPFPATYPRYPSRQQVIDYLEAYVKALDLQPHFGQEVRRVYRHNHVWHTVTADRHYVSRNLIVATGASSRPRIPTWAGQANYQGEIVHSSQYRNGAPYQGKQVLVVGFGNSGGEIAIDLHNYGAHPTLAVRGTINIIPREILGIPVLAIAIPLSYLPLRLADLLTVPISFAAFGNLRRLGLRRSPIGPFTQIQRRGQIPVIDVGAMALIRAGKIAIRPGITRFTRSGVVFTDGSEVDYDAVILATGFDPTVDFIEGLPKDFTSHSEQGSGLYFCGFAIAATGMLREIALEARSIAAAIRQSASTEAPQSSV